MLKLRPYEIEVLQDVADRIESGDEIDCEPLLSKLIACCISECIYQNKIASEDDADG